MGSPPISLAYRENANIKPLLDMALQELRATRPGSAIRILDKALRLNSSNGQALFILGVAWRAKGNFPKAVNE